MKKLIIIAVILSLVVIAEIAFILTNMPDNPPSDTYEVAEEIDENETINKETAKIETATSDEVFYLENAELRLDNYPQYITQIGYNTEGYLGILGFSEYPLIIREDPVNRLNDSTEVQSNSDGTAFLAYASIDEKRVLYYGNNGTVKKITDENIQTARLLSDGDEIAWISGDDDSNNCTVKLLKNGEITILSRKAASYYGSGLKSSEDALLWYENFKQNPNGTGTYTVYLHKDGKTEKLGKDLEIKAFWKGGERIFYEDEYKFYVQNGFDKENRIFITDYSEYTGTEGVNNKNADNPGAIMLSQPDMTNIYIYAANRDLTQAIICVSSYGDYKTIYYEEGKPPKFLINDSIEAIVPAGGTGVDDLSEYYYKTEYYNSSTSEVSYGVYRFDGGELKPVPVSGVQGIMTFSDTDNLLYETDENLFIYDSKTGKSESVFEFEKSTRIFYSATPDLSTIYVRESPEETDTRPLYEIKPDGTKKVIADFVRNEYLDGETLYYLSEDYDLYIYENGNSEKLLSIGENLADTEIDFVFFRDRESEYLTLEVWTVGSSIYFYMSTDGREFVCVEDYLG
jgi:hypothetical protein